MKRICLGCKAYDTSFNRCTDWLLAYLKDQINVSSTPLFFECIKLDNWIWDKKKERWIKVLEKIG